MVVTVEVGTCSVVVVEVVAVVGALGVVVLVVATVVGDISLTRTEALEATVVI